MECCNDFFKQDAMERFFAKPEPLESKLWRGLMFTFVGLGVLAAVAAVR